MQHSQTNHITIMAISNSKLLATKNSLSVFLMIFIFFFLLINNVKSDSSFSFNLPSFETGILSVILGDDVAVSGGALRLTKTDSYGIPLQHSVGLSAHFGPVRIYDKRRGKTADFTTEFSFVVNPKGSELHGDGMTFFIASPDYEFPDNSSGGFLGLFNSTNAFNPYGNQIVVVEFDSYANEWDPNPGSQSPHIGINVNSIRSVASAPWPSDQQPEGAIAKARISYEAGIKQLSVFVTYPNSNTRSVGLSDIIDLRTVLPEWVVIGFSAATGDLVETHDILSWSFSSAI